MSVVGRAIAIFATVEFTMLIYGTLLGLAYVAIVSLTIPTPQDFIFLLLTCLTFGTFPAVAVSILSAFYTANNKRIFFGAIPALALLALLVQYLVLKFAIDLNSSGYVISSTTMERMKFHLINVAVIAGFISQMSINAIWRNSK